MENHRMSSDGLDHYDTHIGTSLDDGTFLFKEDSLDALEVLLQVLERECELTRPARRKLYKNGLVEKALLPALMHLEDAEDTFTEEEITKFFYLAIRNLAILTLPSDCLMPRHPCDVPEMETVVMEINAGLGGLVKHFCSASVTNAILTYVSDVIQGVAENDKPLSDIECKLVSSSLQVLCNVLFSCSRVADVGSRILIIRNLLEDGIFDIILALVNSHQVDVWASSVVQLLILLMTRDLDYAPCARENVTGRKPSCGSINLGAGVLFPPHTQQMDVDLCDVAPSVAGGVKRLFLMEGWSGSSPGTTANSRLTEGCGSGSSSACAKEATSDMECDVMAFIREKKDAFAAKFVQDGFANLVVSLKSLITQGTCVPSHYFSWLVHVFLTWRPQGRDHMAPFSSVRCALSVDVVGLLVYVAVHTYERLAVVGSDRLKSLYLSQHSLAVTALNTVLSVLLMYQNSSTLDADSQRHLLRTLDALTQMRELRQMLVLLLRQWQPETHSMCFLERLVVTNHCFLLMVDALAPHNRTHFDLVEHMKQNFANEKMMLKFGTLLEGFRQISSETMEYIFNMMYHVAGDCQHPQTLMQLPVLQTFIDILDQGTLMKTQDPQFLMHHIITLFSNQLSSSPQSMVRLLCGDVLNENDASANDRQPANNRRGSGCSRPRPANVEGRNHRAKEQEDNLTTHKAEVADDEFRTQHRQQSHHPTRETPQGEATAMKTSNAKSEQAEEKRRELEEKEDLDQEDDQDEEDEDESSSDGREDCRPGQMSEGLVLQAWTQEEENQLLHILSQSCVRGDKRALSVATVVKELEKCRIKKSHLEVTLQLLQLGFKKSDANKDLSKANIPQVRRSRDHKMTDADKLLTLISRLQETHPEYIQWVTSVLLEACYIKAGGRRLGKNRPEEPVALYYSLLHKAIPLVPYTVLQQAAVDEEQVQRLFSKLGIERAHPGNDVFYCLPPAWDANDLLAVASSLQTRDTLLQSEDFAFARDVVKNMAVPSSSTLDIMEHREEAESKARSYSIDRDNYFWMDLVSRGNRARNATNDFSARQPGVSGSAASF